jgi:hypothetical protein
MWMMDQVFYLLKKTHQESMHCVIKDKNVPCMVEKKMQMDQKRDIYTDT